MVAELPLPIATEFSPVAFEFTPTAVAFALLAIASKPSAVERVPEAAAMSPKATDWLPLAVALGPIATESVPVATLSAAVEFAWKYLMPWLLRLSIAEPTSLAVAVVPFALYVVYDGAEIELVVELYVAPPPSAAAVLLPRLSRLPVLPVTLVDSELIAALVANSCEPLIASVLVALTRPAATFVTWRSAPTLPTLTTDVGVVPTKL
ncbi:hypothetical protein WK57_19215 [Burkholderia ubonensis]|uniref:Tash protein PEST motif family n=1 Tax=Burkholderia ubonensis TaxID=101571 RepID=A0A106QFH1_9BURK|nr:hypothetical protein WL29_00705 [Burkholderia ubonensis]KWZ58376.1 hypothetical protein WK57_17920 [Burkholderia ubonensis]KWZ58566.1 hypothetical protein WK57_19215 [Burkholderia ubonensis]